MSHYIPELDAPIKGYMVNFIRANLWRIAETHDFDDAMQEGHLVFLRCAAKYPIIDTPEHFMALFKTAIKNEFHRLAVRAKPHKLTSKPVALSEDMPDLDPIGSLDNDGAFRVLVRQAPEEVLMVLNLFLNAPQELLDMAMTAWRSHGRYRADGEEAIVKMLGLDPHSQPMQATREHFSDY